MKHVLTECRELSVQREMYLGKEYPTLGESSGDNRVSKRFGHIFEGQYTCIITLNVVGAGHYVGAWGKSRDRA